MREICTSGSEGGRAQTNELSLPLSFRRPLSLLAVTAAFLKDPAMCNKLGTKLNVGGTSGAEKLHLSK